MRNYIVWAGTRQTAFESLDEAIEYAAKVNKRNKRPAKILKKIDVNNGVVTWKEIQY
jgi:hypothetical protein